MWIIKQTEAFQDWFEKSDKRLQDDTLEHVEILRQFGPQLNRPYVDTLKGSSIINLKELRFNSGDKVIRIFFVFDPDRNGVLVIGGDKAGSGNKIFYDKMINKSEKIYTKYLEERKKEIEKEQKKIEKKVKTKAPSTKKKGK
ncbi:MAG: type II toxin-antitoxin system RelE/ParE family toxin [Bacteriovorax sp.]|nr:type II toxin-antitoxin system RelE/ParE family toxin [Bacteriovorax sp.]